MADLTLNPIEFSGDGGFDASGAALSVRDHANVRSAETEAFGDSAEDAACEFRAVNGGIHISFEGNNVAPERSDYLCVDNLSTENMRRDHNSDSRPLLADRFRLLRKSLGATQTALAAQLGVHQSAIARWEGGGQVPTPAVLMKMSELAPEQDRQWWRDQATEQAGIFNTSIPLSAPDRERKIFFLSAEEVGLPDSMLNPKAVLTFPEEWFPQGGIIHAAQISSPAPSPFPGVSTIALIDVSRRDPDRLRGKLVAAYTGAGIEPMKLRQLKNSWFLVPMQETEENPARSLRHHGEYSIAGLILKMILEMPGEEAAHAEKSDGPEGSTSGSVRIGWI